MKKLMMILAIAFAAHFAGFGILSASAIDAHHPAAQATKGKKAKKVVSKKKARKSGMQMHCAMMAAHKRQGRTMHSHMHGRMMHHRHSMKCPMMGTAGAHGAGMMHGPSPRM
jgi:hypothetical protein